MNFERRFYVLTMVTFVASSGCGGGLPDSSEVRSQMVPEQLAVSEPVVNSVGMTFVPIPAGEFQMGTSVKSKGNKKPQLPPGAEGEQPQHKVQITESFLISVCEVTQGQYRQVMDETPWKGQPLTKEGDHVAASYISWDQAAEFCRKLSELENAKYRLPTEAEWEYACRAATTTRYSFGDNGKQLSDYAWFDQNAYKAKEQYAHTVGQKLPNAWSLYDMHGNVWEWCSDFHGSYREHLKRSKGDALVDPTGPDKGRQRVWRGGGFAENAVNLRSATRNSFGRVDYRAEFMTGFRVLRVMEKP
ncbi:MAG: formylglycine-generating enzyme family protein [Planctomycetota bacterium]|nr:formylglycine-generating enzyme family protein [Planctomycetota bacterium]